MFAFLHFGATPVHADGGDVQGPTPPTVEDSASCELNDNCEQTINDGATEETLIVDILLEDVEESLPVEGVALFDTGINIQDGDGVSGKTCEGVDPEDLLSEGACAEDETALDTGENLAESDPGSISASVEENIEFTEDISKDPVFCAGALPTDAPCAGIIRTTFQDAVNDATSAGVIYIEPGTFAGTVNITNKNFDLTFLGGVDLGSGTGTTTVDTTQFSVINSSGIIRFADVVFSSTTPIAINNSPNVKIYYSSPYTFTSDITLTNGNVTFEGGDITLASSVEISGSGDVTVQAEAEDTVQVTVAGSVSSKDAKVKVDGNIHPTGNITIQANTARDINIIDTSDISLSSSSLASIEIGSGAVLSGADIQLVARTSGNVIANAGANADASNTFTESATVSINQAAFVTATNGLVLSAETAIQYEARGRVAKNNISGTTSAFIDTTTVTAGAGGVSLTAKDISVLTAVSPQLAIDLDSPSLPVSFEISTASNRLARNVDAYLKSSTVTVTAGDIALLAQRDAKLITSVESAIMSGSDLVAGSFAISVGGTFSVNTVLGDVKAYVLNGTASTITSGDISITAKDTSVLDSKSELSAAADRNSTFQAGVVLPPALLLAPSGSIGISAALNYIGWDITNLFTKTLAELLGAPAASDEKAIAISAYIQDATAVSAGALSVVATSDTRVNATVSNAATSTSAGLYNTASSSSSGILAANRISTRTSGLLSFTSASAGSITAAGNITVRAQDISKIYSNAKIVTSSIVTNDGGAADVRALLNAIVVEHDYKSGDGTQTINFGERILLASDYDSNKGKPNGVYEYMGTSNSINLGTEDYTDYGFWKEVPEAELIPQGNNVTSSDSVALGGVVSVNAIHTDALAYVSKVDLKAADILIDASESATIISTVDSTGTASGGSAYGTGTVIAANGAIASNIILTDAKAYIQGGSVSNTANLTIKATHSASVSATNKSALTSGDTAVGVMLAFNTIGWKAENVFTKAIDALLGTEIGDADIAEILAYALDTTINITGDLAISARDIASTLSDLSNEATAAASALYGATGMATSAILASNMVNTRSRAYLGYASQTTVTVGGSLDMLAEDSATIESKIRLQSISTTTNDGGASILSQLARLLLDDYEYTSKSGSPTLEFGDLVRLAADYDSAKGNPGAIYQYMGTSAALNLATQDYTAYTYWKEVDTSNVVPSGLNISDSDAMGIGVGIARNDVRSEAYTFINNSDLTAVSVTLTADTSAVITSAFDVVAEASGGSSYGSGTVIAGAGAVATNIVLSDTQAYITNSIIETTTGNLKLDGKNSAKIDASLTAAITSGDKAVGGLLAFNTVGWQAQNILFATIDALLGTSIGTEDPAGTLVYLQDTPVTVAGDLELSAVTNAEITSLVSNQVESAASALVNRVVPK